MKRFSAIYPPLIAAYPILTLYSSNQALIPLRDLWRPLTVVVVATTVLWIFLSLILKSIEKGAIAATTLAVGALSIHLIAAILPMAADSIGAVVAPSLLIIGLAILFAKKWKWHKQLSFFAVVLVALPTYQIASEQIRRGKVNSAAITGGQKLPSDRPDIIYIVLDGYGRTDTFERLYKFSDEDFIRGLEDRGFYVAKNAHTNYCQTELSLSSSLNHSYVQDLTTIIPAREGERPTFTDPLERGKVMARLKSIGYQTSAITTGFPSLSFPDVDRKEASVGVNLLESTLLQRLPFGKTSFVTSSMFDTRRAIITKAFERLSTLSDQGSVPQFTVVHILAPHPPFSFGPNGETVPRKGGPYGYWDGSDYISMIGNREAYLTGYAGQATFIGKKILAALDEILSGPGEQPIILIQGDHGPKMGLDQSELAKTDVHECFPILSAYLVPAKVRAELYPEITPVNSFRTVLRAMFGDDLPNLPDRSWYSPYGLPLNFTEVTERLKEDRQIPE